MSAPYDCWEKIIGQTRSDCDCYTGDLEADAGESASGLYADELAGLSLEMIKAAASCATGGNMGALMTLGIEESVKRTKAEGIRGITANTRWKRTPTVNGKYDRISDTKNARTEVNLNSAFHGIDLLLADHMGGFARVKRIGTLMKFTGAFDVHVYGLDDTTPQDTISVNAVDGVITWTDCDILLSMESGEVRNPRYWFLFDGGIGRKALNARVWCVPCGKGPSWDFDNPWFESGIKQNEQAWTKWAMANGTKGTTLADRETWTHSGETQGLLLEMEFGCTASASMCNGTPDYENDPIQQSLAHAVRYAFGSWILETAGVSRNVSRESLSGREAESLLKVRYEERFAEIMNNYITVILSNPPDEDNPHSGVNTYSDCFFCKDKGGPKVRTMRR